MKFNFLVLCAVLTIPAFASESSVVLECRDDRTASGGPDVTLKIEALGGKKFRALIDQKSNSFGIARSRSKTIESLDCDIKVKVSENQDAIELKSFICDQGSYGDDRKNEGVYIIRNNEFDIFSISEVLIELPAPAQNGTERGYMPTEKYSKLGLDTFECKMNLLIK